MRRSACERVTERELFVGRLSFASRLPQYLRSVSLVLAIPIQTTVGTSSYLTTAMFTGAVVLAR